MFAVVGDSNEVSYAAELWRFSGAGGFTIDQPNPVDIQRTAEGTPLDKVSADWATGTDPATHIKALQSALDSGATPFVHFAQHKPTDAIDFYQSQVLPKLR